MTNDASTWKDNDKYWVEATKKAAEYYRDRPELKFGPASGNKAFPMIDYMCKKKCVAQGMLMQNLAFKKPDNIGSILSNVTMAIQNSGNVWAPESGGWYKSEDIKGNRTYTVCPGFADAWESGFAKAWNDLG